MKDSELLREAREAGFQVFLAADHGIAYQQNLEAVPLNSQPLGPATQATKKS